MARRPVRLTPRAFDDIVAIRDYLVARSPQGAENVRRAINATLAQLAAFPLTGRERLEPGVRSIGVPRYGYTIYHRVHETHVEIVHVRHDSRAPPGLGEV